MPSTTAHYIFAVSFSLDSDESKNPGGTVKKPLLLIAAKSSGTTKCIGMVIDIAARRAQLDWAGLRRLETKGGIQYVLSNNHVLARDSKEKPANESGLSTVEMS